MILNISLFYSFFPRTKKKKKCYHLYFTRVARNLTSNSIIITRSLVRKALGKGPILKGEISFKLIDNDQMDKKSVKRKNIKKIVGYIIILKKKKNNDTIYILQTL